jgi:hypothetical protein
MEFCHCQWISKAQCFLAVLFDGYTVLKKGLGRGLRIQKVCPKSFFNSQIMNLDVYLGLKCSKSLSMEQCSIMLLLLWVIVCRSGDWSHQTVCEMLLNDTLLIPTVMKLDPNFFLA